MLGCISESIVRYLSAKDTTEHHRLFNLKTIPSSSKPEELKVKSIVKEDIHERPILLAVRHQRHGHVENMSDLFAREVVMLVSALIMPQQDDCLRAGHVAAAAEHVIRPPGAEGHTHL